MVRISVTYKGNRRLKQIDITKRKAVIGAIVSLVALIVVGGAMMYITYNLRRQAGPPVEIVPIEDVQSTLDKYAEDGKADEGIRFVDAQIGAKENSDKKQDLLIYKSQFAAKVGRTDLALESARQASDMKPGLPSDIALAEAYEEAGDKEQAIKYYQQVVDSIEDNTFMSRYEHKYVEKIKELSS